MGKNNKEIKRRQKEAALKQRMLELEQAKLEPKIEEIPDADIDSEGEELKQFEESDEETIETKQIVYSKEQIQRDL